MNNPEEILKQYLTDSQLELIETLNRHDVEFMLVGAVALACHGYSRYSIDLDFLARPTEKNIKKLFSALHRFFSDTNPDFGSYKKMLNGSQVIRFGSGTNTTEFLTEIDGVSYEEAQEDSLSFEILPDIHLKVIGRKALIKNKMSTGREKDRADASILKKRDETGKET